MFCEVFKPSLEEHLKLFNTDVLNHTIVLFTVDYPYSPNILKHQISTWPTLQWILHQCGNRKHILNVANDQHSFQVLRLFEKIEAMVTENAKTYYFIDELTGKSLRKNIQTLKEKASKRIADVQSQRKKLRALIDGGKLLPEHLRLVMLGAQWSAKSSAGNTILKRDAFIVQSRRTTEYCEVRHGAVANRRLTIVDSPGWFYNHNLSNTCEMDVFEIKNSINMCPPGPHAILLVVGLSSAFSASYQKALQEHMSLFPADIWKHTIVLFTRGDWLGSKTVEERIESEEGLVWLVEKCGNRFHILNNKSCDKEQVTELLDKIEEMVAGNEATHYHSDPQEAEDMEAQRKAGQRKAKRIMQVTQRQDKVLTELLRGDKRQPQTDLRLVLIGRKQSGKSMAGNRILFDEIFGAMWMKKEFQVDQGNRKALKHQACIDRLNMTVVEAPGWSTDTTPDDWVKHEAMQSVCMCPPGPRAFLLVVPISQAFRQSDLRALGQLLEQFGEQVWRHCLVLFTWGDWLSNRSVEEYIARGGEALQRLVEKCMYKYHVLNCNRFNDVYQVINLYEKVDRIISRNKGHYSLIEGRLHKGLAVLTEEEWHVREQELIDRTLRVLVQEIEEPLTLLAKGAASIDGAFIPSMSQDVPSEYESTQWKKSHAKVSEWLELRVGSSGQTSGVHSAVGSENLTDEDYTTRQHFQEKIQEKVLNTADYTHCLQKRRTNSL
ncbi:GTPase IMAP family member 8-like [Eucyclogobius newberryi]|uniref:GTPase IMAP family member 8-like n=1 Tax=Eucyclogobius newberryi TaxID=166745 RepID=UPI003B591D96